jgi:hypothetical protein
MVKREMLNIMCVCVCVCVCVCSYRSYVSCKSHILRAAFYCQLWPVWLYRIFFPHYLIHGMIFGKKSYWTRKVFIPSTNLYETFLILRWTERDIIINVVHRSSYKVRTARVIFSSNLYFRKILIDQVCWKSIQLEPSCAMLTDMVTLIVAFCNFPKAHDNGFIHIYTHTHAHTHSRYVCVCVYIYIYVFIDVLNVCYHPRRRRRCRRYDPFRIPAVHWWRWWQIPRSIRHFTCVRLEQHYPIRSGGHYMYRRV